MVKNLVPKVKVKAQDLDANPAICKEDWDRMNKWIRFTYIKEGEEHPRPSTHYFRYLFWHFTLIMKNTGARPNELLNLRWKDVQVDDVGRISKSKLEEEIQELEAEGIEVIPDGSPLGAGDWARNENELGREKRLVSYIFVKQSKTGNQREIPCNLGKAFVRLKKHQVKYLQDRGHPWKVTPNSLVFGQPDKEFKPYTYNTFTTAWWRMMRALDGLLIGHKFSDRNYTIYSMRSTYIENMLLHGMDIFLLSRICGHSVDILKKHYERLDIKERAEEITRIRYGETKKEPININLFPEEQDIDEKGEP